MLLLTPETHDPFFNLALEEILLKGGETEYLIISVNQPSVIIGKHQSPYMEADPCFTFHNKIPVIRRISGGGTVYHDEGNLNFAFIRNSEEGRQVDFRKYTRPVIDFLQSFGISAELRGTSDIVADGFKISGNAEHVYKKRVLHHGTLLFDASLEYLRGSIRSDKTAYQTRAVNSNPSAVTNLKGKLKMITDISDLKRSLIQHFEATIPDLTASATIQSVAIQAEELATKKYRTWDWNFAYGPDYVFSKLFEFDGITHSCTLNVRKGVVQDALIAGSAVMNAVGIKMVGCRHTVEDFTELFEKEKVRLTEEEVFNFF